MHGLRRLRRHLPGRQRADARHPRDPPAPGADGERVPRAAAGRLPRHGAHGQSLEPGSGAAAGVGRGLAACRRSPSTRRRNCCGGSAARRRLDARAQKTAQAFARVLLRRRRRLRCAGRGGALHRRLGARAPATSTCSPNWRSGNVETLNRVAPRRIVTTCPHCLHTLKNEYPAFGGNYDVHPSHAVARRAAAPGPAAAGQDRRRLRHLPRPLLPGSPQSVFEAPRQAAGRGGRRGHRAAAPRGTVLLLRRRRRADVEGRGAR